MKRTSNTDGTTLKWLSSGTNLREPMIPLTVEMINSLSPNMRI